MITIFLYFDCYHTHKVKCRFNSDGDDILMKHGIVISYPRSSTSKVRGLKNRNILYFQEMYPQFSIDWCEDNTEILFVAVLMAYNICFPVAHENDVISWFVPCHGMA